MQKEFNFLMAIHFHQPVDNFGFVFEEISDKCYEPFLYAIQDFPSVKFNLHYSGSLLEWFRDNRPNVLELIARLIETGQVEIVSGGFYEPILSSVSYQDAAGQIAMMTGFLKANFKTTPQGAWLAERIWEPQIPEILSDAGMKYTIIDDQHLIYAGCKEDRLYGHYMTEYNGKTLNVIPSDKPLRYAIPFQQPQASIEYFKKIVRDYGRHTVCYGDDGEKFGAWPNTYNTVYEKGWLKRFLQLLEKNSSWVRTWKISDYLNHARANGIIYIPNVSYEEMNEWSLPADAAESLETLKQYLKKRNMLDKYSLFLRTGTWKNFLIKYPESNHIHKRVALASRRFYAVEASGLPPAQPAGSADFDLLTRAKREIYKAQCNCVYWHGVFGGLYLYHLRASLFKHLIEAERLLDILEAKKEPRLEIDEIDFDCDGENELIVSTSKNTIIIDNAHGGAVTEWSLKTKPLNIVNTLARRREPYHRKAKKKIFYDNYRRGLFIDRFLPPDISLKSLKHNQYTERGDFAQGRYQVCDTRPVDGIGVLRQGIVNGSQIMLRKIFTFGKEKETIRVSYTFDNLSLKPMEFQFAPELNFSITQDDRESCLPNAENIKFHDKIEGIRVDIDFSQASLCLFRYPVYTLSQTQEGLEDNYQATCIIPVFQIAVGKDSSAGVEISISIKDNV
ncbi:MAG: alpha-amylase/4-alpha-glucanotransferase domain-containing protein [Candidatus Omnitrophota bacterium]|jgi:alpha-amylase